MSRRPRHSTDRPASAAASNDPVARRSHPSNDTRMVRRTRHVLLLPIKRLDASALSIIRYAGRLRARTSYVVHVAGDDAAGLQFADRWEALALNESGLQLRVVVCSQWAVGQTLADSIRDFADDPGLEVTVLLSGRPRAGRLLAGSPARRALAAVIDDYDNVVIGDVAPPRR